MTKGTGNGQSEPIDFSWLIYIGMNKLGFTYRQTMQMYFGFWMDLFETYKRQHNFEMKRGLYNIQEDEPVSSLSVL